MKQIFLFLLGSLILSAAYSSLHASGGGADAAAAPAEAVTQGTGLKALLSELQKGEITSITEVPTLLPRLSCLSHEEIKSFLDAIEKKEELTELSRSLRSHIMFVSYFVKNEEDTRKNPLTVISENELFQKNEFFIQRSNYFDANALRVYKAIINPEEAGKAALYKYSKEEPFFIIAWAYYSEGLVSYRSYAHHWTPGNTNNSVFFGDESIQNIGELSLPEVQLKRSLMGTKIKNPRAFIENFFTKTPEVQGLFFNKFNYKHTLPWAFEDLAFQNEGTFSLEDIRWIFEKIQNIENLEIQAALKAEVAKYPVVTWSIRTHRFCSEERRERVRQVLLATNRNRALPMDCVLKILGLL